MTGDVMQSRELRSRWIEATSLDPRLSDAVARIAAIVAARFMHLQPGPKCGSIWPGAGTVAKETGKCLRTVKQAFSDLRELGYLHPIKMGGGKQPSIYKLTIPAVSGATPVHLDAPVNSHAPVQPDALPGATRCTTPVQPAAPNTLRRTLMDDTQGKVPPSEGAGAPSGNGLSLHANRVAPPVHLAGEKKPDPQKPLFDYGKSVLGNNAGGLIAKLLKHHDRDVPSTMRTLQEAAGKGDPREYVGGILSGEVETPTDWGVEYRRMGVWL
jgi:hypothetical protein